MLKNTNSSKAKTDEVYTSLGDIEKELRKYDPNVFKGKVIFCSFDDPNSKSVWRFFHMNFHRLGLKKLIATHYAMDGSSSYAMTYDSKNPQDDVDFSKGTKFLLKGDGDFRSLLKQSDMVVRNLPFSFFGEYIAQLEQYNHPYNVIGDYSAIICKAMFPLLKAEKTVVWLFAA